MPGAPDEQEPFTIPNVPPLSPAALAFLLTGRSCRRKAVLTGEIALRGRVLVAGGVREKLDDLFARVLPGGAPLDGAKARVAIATAG
jgi:Lon protease (S16) C-terminal proteolytic domain